MNASQERNMIRPRESKNWTFDRHFISKTKQREKMKNKQQTLRIT